MKIINYDEYVKDFEEVSSGDGIYPKTEESIEENAEAYLESGEDNFVYHLKAGFSKDGDDHTFYFFIEFLSSRNVPCIYYSGECRGIDW